MKVLLDTSVLRAALDESHQYHNEALTWLQKAQSGEVDGIISTHILAELYSNLSGQIRPLIPTSHALDLITRNILMAFEIVPLTQDDYLTVLQRLAQQNIRGGAIYDGLIVHAAIKANAEQIITFNERDFIRISASLPIQITSP